MSSRWRTLLLTSALVPFGIAPALAGPNGATVVGGAATVQGQGTANVVVNQSTQNAIINWNTFNIGAGEKTTITMPSSTSAELDRVTGGLGPSQILGTLSSNGRVFLVNPDGILFGAGARINVGSLLATTNDIADSDFMAGRYTFSIPGNPDASVVNLGSITAQTDGFAALVAPGVRNAGVITARLGTIALASGNAFTLDMYGDNLITLGLNDSIASQVVDVSTGKPLSSLVGNSGKLKANGGTVVLTAVAAREVVDSVINNTGVIEANTVGTHNGMIVLGAATAASKPAGAPTQTVKVSGKLSAAGKRKGTNGGTVVVTGENVALNGATIDVSGSAGGGAVLIGGDWGGGNPNTSLLTNASAYLEPYAVPNASTVSVDTATVINASATTTGNGGKVVVWSDGATTFNGTILSEGGAQSGNGGFVETSGHQLSFSGTVDTAAPNGRTGLWLLDPYDLTIDSTAASTISSNLANTNVTVQTTAAGYSGPGNAVSGEGDINVDASITWSSNTTLTLSAYNNINLVYPVVISNTGGGSLILRADNSGDGLGTVQFIPTIIPITGRFIIEFPEIDFSNSTGTVSIYYNSPDNPAGSGVNPTSYTSPSDFSGSEITNSAVPNQFTAYMLVNTVYDLQNIENNLSGDYALGKDIDASATASWNSEEGFIPIGVFPAQFSGIFEGGGHVINNLFISSSTLSQGVGLFGTLGSGTIENVGLVNGSVTGTGIVGGLVGVNRSGTIGYSYSEGILVTGATVGGLVGLNYSLITNSYSSSTVNGIDGSAGGLAGENGSLFTNQYNPETYGVIQYSYATGSVTGVGTVGGLVGSNTGGWLEYSSGGIENYVCCSSQYPGSGLIYQSYATSPVNGVAATGGSNGAFGGLIGSNSGIIIQSFATGAVTERGSDFYPVNKMVGGLVGIDDSGTITESYATGAVSGYDTGLEVGGLIGRIDGTTINQSYATGAVSGASPDQSYLPRIGGFIADNFGGSSITESYWDTQTTGQSISGAGAPLSTSTLTVELPPGFDPTLWIIQPGVSFPYFPWQPANTIPFAPVTPYPTPTPAPITTVSDSVLFPSLQVVNLTQPINTIVAESTPPVVNNLNSLTTNQTTNGGNGAGVTTSRQVQAITTQSIDGAAQTLLGTLDFQPLQTASGLTYKWPAITNTPYQECTNLALALFNQVSPSKLPTDLTKLGNATSWYANAAAYEKEMPAPTNVNAMNSLPVGSIIVWAGGADGLGHLAVVTGNKNGSLTVLEANWEGQYVVDQATLTYATVAARSDNANGSTYTLEGFILP